MPDSRRDTLYVNTYRREYFNPADLPPDGLAGHALAVLLQDKDGLLDGRWAGEPLFQVDGASRQSALHRAEGETCPTDLTASDILQLDYVDITPLLIAHFCREAHQCQAFLLAIPANPALLINLMNIAESLGCQPLRQAILAHYGGSWHELYNKRYAWLTDLGQTEQVRTLDPQIIHHPQPSPPTAFIQRHIRERREQEPEDAHAIEIVNIEGAHVTAQIQVCPPLRLDGKPIKEPLNGISYFGRMHFADPLFILRALLSAWRNLPSGIHFTALPVSAAEAQTLHKQATHRTPLRTLSKSILRHPVGRVRALQSADFRNQHHWIGEQYRSSLYVGVQVSPVAWQSALAWHDQAREIIPDVQVFLTEEWWNIPKADEIARWEFTVQDPAWIDFLRVGMRWRFFGSATLCSHCGVVESGLLVKDRSEYQRTYQDPYEEQGVVFKISEYRCRVCGHTWDETLTEKYRDSSYP